MTPIQIGDVDRLHSRRILRRNWLSRGILREDGGCQKYGVRTVNTIFFTDATESSRIPYRLTQLIVLSIELKTITLCI